MRTTLKIDDDVLIAAKELAISSKTTAGKVISEFARRGFRSVSKEAGRVRNGFELLPAGGTTVTVKLVDELWTMTPENESSVRRQRLDCFVRSGTHPPPHGSLVD